MSTKTTFKRVALVAVAALGLGVLTSVAPASAATADVTAITAGASAPARVGVLSGTTTLTVAHRAQSDSYTVTAQITAAPSTSSVAGLTFAAGTGTTATVSDVATKTGAAKLNAVLTADEVASADVTATGTTGASTLTLSINPDVAGTYTILVAVGGNTTTGFAAGNKSVSYTVTTAGTPTALTLASSAGSVTSAGLGQIFSLSMKDAAGNATVLGLNESIDITDNTTLASVLEVNPKASSNGSAVTAIGSATANTAGVYYLRVGQTGTLVTGTAILTLTGGGLLPSSLTVNASITLTLTAADPSAASTVKCTTAANCTGTAPNFNTAAGQSLTFTNAAAVGNATADATTAKVYNVDVINASGFRYSSSSSVAAAATAAKTATFTAPAPTATAK